MGWLKDYWTQVKSLLRRILIIKARIKKQACTEFLWPILFIIILALIRYMANVSTVDSDAIEAFVPESLYPESQLSGEILVVPDTAADFVIQAVRNYVENSSRIAVNVFSDIDSAESYYRQNHDKVLAGVIFHNELFDNYTIRTKFWDTPSPLQLRNSNEDCRPDSPYCPSKQYISNGFLALQWALDTALLEKFNVTVPDLLLQQLAKSSFIPDSSFIRQFAPVYYVYIYSFFIQFLVYGLVAEKASKLKEMLRIMGMKDSAFWLSWSLLYLAIIVIVSGIAVMFAYLTAFFSVHSDMSIFFLLLTLYGCTIINLSFVISTFLSNPNVAGPVAVLATTAVSSAFVIVSLTTTYDANGTPSSILPLPFQWALCLLSPTALSIAIERAIYLDVSQIGITWASLYLGDFPLVAPIIMLAVDTVLYFFLAVWLDNVIPGQFGKSLPLCYCMQPSYWKSISRRRRLSPQRVYTEPVENISDCPHIEPVTDDMKNLNKLQLINIKKTYKVSGKNVDAVKGITLDIYENEITCILGHNGAGKSTLMNMLTGLTPPSAGTALIYGHDIRDTNDMISIRRFTGLCPQHDILIDNMTCKEHLLLYASLKGVGDTNTIEQEVNRILKDVDLVEKADCYSKNLSGGQKRKLSVGIAFIGNPKIIFLDEPSAGMDPRSRRHLWALLKSKKAGRIILLTTHFMDEADILADRKAIVSSGKLKCCGSSLYLKTKFGIGYNLNLVVHPKTYKTQEVEFLVHECVPGSAMAHRHGMEICFSLPMEQTHKFSDLFRKLEETCYDKAKRATLLGITSYGISMTTLEEVFLRLAEIAESEEAEVSDLKTLGRVSSHRLPLPQNSETSNKNKEVIVPPRPRLSLILEEHSAVSKPNSFQRFLALAKIRMMISLRDKMATFSRIILPAILIMLSAVILKSASIQYNPPLSSIVFDPQTVFEHFDGKFAVVDNRDDVGEIAGIVESASGLTARYITELEQLHTDRSWHFGLIFSEDNNISTPITLLYNDTWVHSLPMLLNLLTNSLLIQSYQDTNITTYSQPWGSIEPRYVFHGSIFTFATMIGFSLIFLPSSFAQAAVWDRAIKAKSQLRIAGVTQRLYWISICAVDFAQYMIVGLALLLSFVIFQLRPLLEIGAFLCTVLFLIMYIPIYTLSLYIMSYGFDQPENSQGLLQTSSILLNIIFFVPVGMTALSENDYHRGIADLLHLVFTFINPFYSASGFFMYLLKFDISKSYTQQSDQPIIRIASYFFWENKLLPTFLAPFFWLPFLALLLWIVETKKSGRSLKSAILPDSTGSKAQPNKHKIEFEDEDVAAERYKVELAEDPELAAGLHHASSMSSGEPVLVVRSLHKEFVRPMMKSATQKMVAVKNLTFRVMPGEVLGLLGPNGAGKSTTLNMLTAEIIPDAGMVRAGSTNMYANVADAYKQMGYCPQFDAVWPNITIREHLAAYCVLRGYHPDLVKPISNYFLDLLQLNPHADKETKMLSGGTRRKLSFAMAMLGNPKVVMLDEPSTGMDPQSKRIFWDAINHMFADSGRGAILTTHYMEEADALCHRIGIMINGQLECLGTTQHLKNRFGHGYMLEVKLASMKEDTQLIEAEKLNALIFHHYPSTHILEQFGPRVSYKISAFEVTSLARTFEILEQAKAEIDIGEYNFSQATLEQVFLEFAKFQREQSNTSKEQSDLSHSMASCRQVTALHSKVNSAVQLPNPTDDDLRSIESDLKAAVAKYVNQQIKVGAVASGRQSGVSHITPEKSAGKLSDRDSQIYGFSQNRPPGKQASSTYGIVDPAVKFTIKQSSTANSGGVLKTGQRTSVKPTPIKKEGERSAVKFDTKHMVGSTVSTTNNESTALFRRTKMPPSDLIEADESKAQNVPWTWIDDKSDASKVTPSNQVDEQPSTSQPDIHGETNERPPIDETGNG